MAFSFPVDDVMPAGQRLPEGNAALAQRFGGEPIAVGDGVFPLVEAGNEHPLLAAVALAYNTHRPLLLSPDVIDPRRRFGGRRGQRERHVEDADSATAGTEPAANVRRS
jgi:hypothetical protein